MTDKIVSRLNSQFCEDLLWVYNKANEVNYLAVSSPPASSQIGKKIKYLQAKERICRESKDNVIGREITTVLKITVDNAILELCDSCNFFASPLINTLLRSRY